MYLKIVEGSAQEYSLAQLRQDNPNVSFPALPSDAVLAGFDVFPFTEDEVPVHDPRNQTLSAGAFYQVGEEWHRGWTVTDFVPVEISQVQLFDALEGMGHWGTFEPLLAANPRWEFITEIPRTHPTLVSGARAYFVSIGQTEDDADAFIDSVFRYAVTL